MCRPFAHFYTYLSILYDNQRVFKFYKFLLFSFLFYQRPVFGIKPH